MKPVPLDSRFFDLSRKNILQNSSICLGPVSSNSYLNHILINTHASSSYVGPVFGGLFPQEEKVEQEVFEGPQAQSFKCITLSKTSPSAYSSYKTNMPYFTLFYYI
jgi:hypothetical protein